MQLRTINKKLAALDEHLELERGEGYHYFIYDDTQRNIYETKSVMVPRLNDLTEEMWLSDAHDFLAQLGVFK